MWAFLCFSLFSLIWAALLATVRDALKWSLHKVQLCDFYPITNAVFQDIFPLYVEHLRLKNIEHWMKIFGLTLLGDKKSWLLEKYTVLLQLFAQLKMDIFTNLFYSFLMSLIFWGLNEKCVYSTIIMIKKKLGFSSAYFLFCNKTRNSLDSKIFSYYLLIIYLWFCQLCLKKMLHSNVVCLVLDQWW